MKKLKYLPVVLMLGLLVFLTSSTGYVKKQNNFAGKRSAQFHRGMHKGMQRGMDFRMFSALTQEQRDQIEKIRTEQMKKALPLRNQIAEKKAKLRTPTTGDNIDQKAADKVLADIEGLKLEPAKQMVRTRLDIRNVLTDEQKIIFDAHSEMMGMHGKGFKRVGMHGHFGHGKPMPCAGRGMMPGKPGMQKGQGMAMKGMQNAGHKGIQQRQGMKPGMGKGMKQGKGNGNGFGPGQGKGMPGKPGMKGRPGMMQGQMPWMKDMTQEQKDQLKALRLEEMKAMTHYKNKLAEYQARLKTLTTSDDVNLKDVDKVIDQMSKIKLDMAKEKLKHRLDVRNILTDEQKVRFDMHI